MRIHPSVGSTHKRGFIAYITHESVFPIDDPYYYLYYGKSTRSPSYFTLELQEPEVGRVLRFDSMSKILSAGIRIGFVSGPEAILTAMDRHVRRFFTSQRFLLMTPSLGCDFLFWRGYKYTWSRD